MSNRTHFGGIRLLMLTLLLLAAGFHMPSFAADSGEATPSVDKKLLESKIKEVEATSGIDAPTKEKLTELYRKALTNLEKMHSFAKDAASFLEARDTAPVTTEKLRKELQKKQSIVPEKTLKLSQKISLQELDQRLQKEKADLAAINARLSDFVKRLEFQAGRPAAARERLITARGDQQTAISDGKAAAPAGELAAVTQARKWVFETQAFALSAEIKMLDRELLSHQQRVKLLEVRKEIAEQDMRLVGARLRLLEDTLTERRVSEAALAAAQAQAMSDEFKGEHRLVQEIAEQNLTLGEELQSIAREIERVAALDDMARDSAKRLADDLSTVKQKLQIGGLSGALGRILMQQRQSLPSIGKISADNNETERLISSASLQQIQYSEKRKQLVDIEAFIAQLTKDLPGQEASALHSKLNELAVNQHELLEKAIANLDSYLRTLGELDLAQHQLIVVVQDYVQFLGKRLLWVRSSDAISLSMFDDLPAEIGRLLSPAGWNNTIRNLLLQLKSSPLGLIILLVLAGLTLARRRFLELVVAAGEKTGRIRTDRYSFTLEALGWTTLASIPLPLLLMTIGWQLSIVAQANEFTQAVAIGLIRMSLFYLIIRYFTDVAFPGGLAARHFRWPDEVVEKLRLESRLLMLMFLPSVFVIRHSMVMDGGNYGSGALVTLAVLVAIVAVGLFLFRSFTPDGGILKGFLARRPNSLLTRMRPVWVGLLIAYAIGMVVLVLTGYLYTSGTLTRDLVFTIWMVYLIVIIRGMFLRWLLLVRRRLAFQAAIERREAARLAREAEQTEKASHVVDDLLEIDEPEVDLSALDSESRKLLDTTTLFAALIALWFIWAPILPAFGILQDISLWSSTEVVEGIEKVVPITLANIALAIIVAIVTFTAARGLPAFLEFILLQRISITVSARYTATTLMRYVIAGVGITLFFTILGARWSQIQWLVAALTVGIGFGLQEIVANFISGLIILFERPIRVGDTVTVGEVSGVVSKINIRATTITNWDRQELLVPNKEFITTRLLNWSLSDPIIRVVVPVGIAYGGDVSRAMALMLEAAREHHNVLDEPASSVTFESFGDNALQLNLRAFLPSLEERMATITDLHMRINDKFNEAGIVISFPQRDVHIDGLGPIDVRLHKDDVVGDDKQ
jgi:potassium efflux system protein